LQISSEHDWFTGDEVYDWQSTVDTARVEVRIRGYHHGNLRVRVFDARGAEVFDKIYWYWDDVYIIGGDEYLDIGYTGVGEPGLWSVVLDFGEFTGHLYLTLEDSGGGEENEVQVASEGSRVVDDTFGVDGRATFSEFRSYGLDSARDGADRLLVVGTVIDDFGSRRLAAWRLFPDGAFDVNFGDSGIVIYDDGNSSIGRGVAIDAAGRILITGWVANSSGDLDMILVRLDADGSLDSSFGTGGLVTFDEAGLDDIGAAVQVDSSGRIVVAGNSRDFDTNLGMVFCKRYLVGGAPDPTFGAMGSVETTNNTDRCADMKLDLDRPTILGERNADLAIWRYTGNGLLDSAFGTAGVVGGVSQPGEERFGLGLAIRDSDGAIAACGFRGVGVADIELAVWRYDTDGLPQSSFGGDGLEGYAFPGGEAIGTDLLFDGSDRLVVSGVTRTSGLSGDDGSATFWRFDSVGALDPAVGTIGAEQFDSRTTRNIVTVSADLEPDSMGGFYAVGSAVNVETGGADLTVWRLTP